MSRSTVAKSRAEKGGKSATAATPAITHEIVSGKLNDQDWNAMLDLDEGDDFIIDIVEDVCSTALDIIFSNYIQKQLVPYTVLQAKDAIVQIIEWQFLSRDEGETQIEDDPGWLQDEEPEPAITDCWAQGSVPRTIMKPSTPDLMTPHPTDVEGLEQIDEENTLDVAAAETEDNIEASADSLPVEEQDDEKEEGESPLVATETEAPAEKKQSAPSSKKNGGSYKRYCGKLNMDSLSKLTESLDEVNRENVERVSPLRSPDLASYQMPSSCQSLLKLQAGRPPGNHDVVYDEYGNVMGITKINIQKLPSHKIKTGFVVVNPSVEAAQSRLEAMRTGRYVKANKTTSKLSPRPPVSPRSSKTGTSVVRSSQTSVSSKMQHALGGSTHEGMSGLPPPLIEAMEVSPGVEVREGDRVKTGPRQHPKKADLLALTTQHQLRPIRSKANIPTITVLDLLGPHSPIVKPIADTSPIPPIQSPQISS